MKIIPSQTVVMLTSNVPPGDNQTYMFDNYLNQQTENPDSIEVTIEFNNCDRLALFNIQATDIDVILTDNTTSSVVYSTNIDLEMSDGEYMQWVILPIYIYADATLGINLNYTGGTAKCGKCGIGLSADVGSTLYSPIVSMVDFSKKSVNEFGNTYLLQGAWAKRNEVRTQIPISAVDSVYEDLTGIRGSLAFFEGNETDTDFESLRIFGFLENWRIRIDNPAIAWVDLTIQGVI